MTTPTEVTEAYAAVIQTARQVAEWGPEKGEKFWELLPLLGAAVEKWRTVTDPLDGLELDVMILRAIAERNPAAVKVAYQALQDALISQLPPFIGGEPQDEPDTVEMEIQDEHRRLLGIQHMAQERFIKTLAVKYKEHGWNVGHAATKYLEASERTIEFVRNHPQIEEI